MLQAHGLQIVVRNFRCRGGELDLVAREGDTWVFVEVRLRRNTRYGTPAESITRAKQRRLHRAIRVYLATLPPAVDCRIDVVLFTRLRPPDPQWIRDAW